MRFKIERTEEMVRDYSTGEPPCEGSIYCEVDDCWYIEISTLEELMLLQSKVKWPIIIDPVSIEIYDDFRE